MRPEKLRLRVAAGVARWRSLPVQRSWASSIFLNLAAVHRQWWRVHMKEKNSWAGIKTIFNNQIDNHDFRPLPFVFKSLLKSTLPALLLNFTEIDPMHSAQVHFSNLEHHTMKINIQWYMCISYYQGMIRIYSAVLCFCHRESKILSILQIMSKCLNKLEG
jgi:hypothetical protein